MDDNFWGKSASINLGGCNDNVSNPKKIREFVDALCKKISMKKYGILHLKKFGYGELEGYSCMQFIETSSVTCHFDEKMGKSNRAFIDIFSCKDFNEKIALKFCRSFFQAKTANMKTFIRR